MLSLNEMRNSIYLDFEGEGRSRDGITPKPCMAGVFRPNTTGNSGSYNCVFFQKSWEAAANGIANAEQVDFDYFFSTLLMELKLKSGFLVFWTEHEKKMLEMFLPSELLKRIEPFFYNIHPPAKKYLNKKKLFDEGITATGKSLEECYAVIYPRRQVAFELKPGPAETCRRIESACKNEGWGRFSDTQKNYVKNLVKYNEGDCRSTWLIAKKVIVNYQ